ncbi:hypothetical protein BC833DRAFT_562777 [Globomyces pollinis-pini]|nr:hypothetical protein BC833DRAFT_562777 [Globomyces pollinis-pini]
MDLSTLSNENQLITAVSNDKLSVSDTHPRTQHDLSNSISAILQSNLYSNSHVTDKLFEKYEEGMLIDHQSDYDDPEVEDNMPSAISDISLTDYDQHINHGDAYEGYIVAMVNQENQQSLQGSLAHQLYKDAEKFDKLERDCQEFLKHQQLKQPLDLSKPPLQHHRIYLQLVANVYQRAIHIHLAIKSRPVEIISPFERSFKEPIHLLQFGINRYASLNPNFSTTRRKSVKINADSQIINDESGSLRDEIVQSFIAGQQWTEEDDRKHQLTLKGSSSINDSCSYMIQGPSPSFDQSSYMIQGPRPSFDQSSFMIQGPCPSFDQGGGSYHGLYEEDSLASKVESSNHYSPSLKRKIKVPKESSKESNLNDEEFYELQRALQESILDQKQQPFESNIEESFDEELQMALELSRQDLQKHLPSDSKGKGKLKHA